MQRHTAKRVYDRLKGGYPEFDASDRSVRTLVAKLKEELNLKKEGYLLLEHPPGGAQVDFGSATFIENGVEFEGNYLNISFPYSNGGYTQLFKAENQECCYWQVFLEKFWQIVFPSFSSKHLPFLLSLKQ